MATIAVLGAGLGGAAAALLLARRGHDVTVFERDEQPVPSSVEEAWERWERPGVTQLRQSHFFLARLYQELTAHAPDVLDALVVAGAVVVPWTRRVPPALRAGLPADVEEIEGIAARRTTVERVLHDVLAREPRAGLRLGEAVGSLVAGPSVVAGVPHVVGLRTATGETVRADLVVDAAGRRSPGTTWLAALGARPPLQEAHDNRLTYYTRYYRLRDGVSAPDEHGMLITSLPYLEFAVFPADHGVFSVTCMAYADDKPMRSLRDADVFTRAVGALPRVARWIDPDVSVPITPVKPIAAVEDRYRRFVVDGTPVATGYVAVGDASTCTNPALGRGTSLAFVHARLLAEAVDATGLDHAALARRLDEVTEAEIVPWYRGSLAVDRERLARMQAGIAGLPTPEPDPSNVPALLAAALRLSTAVDARAFWGFAQVTHLLRSPAEVLADDSLVDCITEVWERRREVRPPMPGPDRDTMVELLAPRG